MVGYISVYEYSSYIKKNYLTFSSTKTNSIEFTELLFLDGKTCHKHIILHLIQSDWRPSWISRTLKWEKAISFQYAVIVLILYKSTTSNLNVYCCIASFNDRKTNTKEDTW